MKQDKENKRHAVYLLIGSLVCFLCLNSCGGGGSSGGGSSEAEYTYRVPEQIGDGWTTVDLASKSVNVGPIEDMIRSIKGGFSAKIHSVLIVLDGDLVLEEYFPGYEYMYNNFNSLYVDYNRDIPHHTASAGKSIVSALIGIALDQGLISGIEESLYDFFPQYSQFNSPEKSLITLRHALTMTAGFNWNESSTALSSEQNDLFRMLRTDDWYGYILSKGTMISPGQIFDYNSALTMLLGGVVQQASGLTAWEFAEDYLFEPLGFDTRYWTEGPNGEIGGLALRPRDMAKFGLLYLNKGVWNSTQVVSEGWVDESTARCVTFGPVDSFESGYGYQWWQFDFEVDGEVHESYAAWGWGGQHIFVFPQFDMVVVFTGGDYLYQGGISGPYYLKFFILPAVLEARSGSREYRPLFPNNIDRTSVGSTVLHRIFPADLHLRP